MFLLIGKILSLSFVNITMEIMSLLHYLLNKETMSLETMSPSAMGTRSYEVQTDIWLDRRCELLQYFRIYIIVKLNVSFENLIMIIYWFHTDI